MGLRQNLLHPRHRQHCNVIPPKAPYTSQADKKKQPNLCAGLPSHVLVFLAGWSPTFWQSPACPAATQPVQRELQRCCDATANAHHTDGANSEVMVTSSSTWPFKKHEMQVVKKSNGSERPRGIACCLPFCLLAVCELTCLQRPVHFDGNTGGSRGSMICCTCQSLHMALCRSEGRGKPHLLKSMTQGWPTQAK